MSLKKPNPACSNPSCVKGQIYAEPTAAFMGRWVGVCRVEDCPHRAPVVEPEQPTCDHDLHNQPHTPECVEPPTKKCKHGRPVGHYCEMCNASHSVGDRMSYDPDREGPLDLGDFLPSELNGEFARLIREDERARIELAIQRYPCRTQQERLMQHRLITTIRGGSDD